MSDLVLGMIIGGVIGVVGSAAVAFIQGHYSLKGKREENSARQQQQSAQIQHEKDSQLMIRRIAVRSRYLEPLSSHLCDLYISIDKYAVAVIDVLTPYYTDSKRDEVKVSEVDKKAFIQAIEEIQSTFMEIFAPRKRVCEVSAQVADHRLTDKINELGKQVLGFYDTHEEMYKTLHDSTTEKDSVYDFKGIMASMYEIKSCISSTHNCIESLLSGVNEDNE